MGENDMAKNGGEKMKRGGLELMEWGAGCSSGSREMETILKGPMCQWTPGRQVTSNNNYYDNIATKKDSFQEHVFILHTVYSVET